MGVAWISADAHLEKAARGLADDVVVFDQRGCLSPRIALVLGDEARASALADALHAELERLDVSIPRGAVPAEERAAAGRYVATMTYACRALVGTPACDRHRAAWRAARAAPAVSHGARRGVLIDRRCGEAARAAREGRRHGRQRRRRRGTAARAVVGTRRVARKDAAAAARRSGRSARRLRPTVERSENRALFRRCDGRAEIG